MHLPPLPSPVVDLLATRFYSAHHTRSSGMGSLPSCRWCPSSTKMANSRLRHHFSTPTWLFIPLSMAATTELFLPVSFGLCSTTLPGQHLRWIASCYIQSTRLELSPLPWQLHPVRHHGGLFLEVRYGFRFPLSTGHLSHWHSGLPPVQSLGPVAPAAQYSVLCTYRIITGTNLLCLLSIFRFQTLSTLWRVIDLIVEIPIFSTEAVLTVSQNFYQLTSYWLEMSCRSVIRHKLNRLLFTAARSFT